MAPADSISLFYARRFIRALLVLNVVAGVFIALLFVASLVLGPFFVKAMSLGANTPRLMTGVRAIMLLGIASVPAVQLLLRRLLSIVDTVQSGDPFTPVNAGRLRTIGWSLVALETIHLLIGLMTFVASTDSAPLDIGWNLSATRWLTVLLVFVLAQVFEHGAVLRDDVVGTV